MREFIKSKLRETLTKPEVGNREDARFASAMPTYPPFINLLVQVDNDYGKESKLYVALMDYFIDGNKSFSGVMNILKAFNVEDQYGHFLHINENL
jgi:hypothetical protein